MIKDIIITVCALLCAQWLFTFTHGKEYGIMVWLISQQVLGIGCFIFIGWKEISLGYSIKKLLKKGKVDAAIKEANKE